MSVKTNNPDSILDRMSTSGLPVSKNVTSTFFVFAFVLSFPVTTMAYVGPGAGITALGALWAVIVAVLFTVGGILIWPIRTMLRRRKRAAAQSGKEVSAEIDQPDNS